MGWPDLISINVDFCSGESVDEVELARNIIKICQIAIWVTTRSSSLLKEKECQLQNNVLSGAVPDCSRIEDLR